MKSYFISFDYWTTTKNKFISAIVDYDLSEISLNQVCREMIKKQDHDEHIDSWAIKILAFNNIK